MKKTGLFLLAMILLFCLPGQTSPARAQEPSAAPGQFAFFDGNNNLWLVQGELKEPVIIAHPRNGYIGSSPRFSKDGNFLAYCIYPNQGEGTTSIYIADTVTLEKQEIATDGSCSFDWSPDGKTLIYTPSTYPDMAQNRTEGVFAFSTESGATQMLISSESALLDPRWSPDGKAISYFDFCFECVGQFYTFNVATSEKRAWSGEDWNVGPDVSWSPDGQSLASDRAIWSYIQPGETWGLQVSSSDGQSHKEIFSMPGKTVVSPLWSPDGKRIAFLLYETKNLNNVFTTSVDLLTIAPDGSDAIKLYSSDKMIYLQAWSADSHYLFFTEQQKDTNSNALQDKLTLLDAQTGKLEWRSAATLTDSVDASVPAPVAPMPTPAAPATSLSRQTGLFYVTSNYALAFYQPETGYTQRLSEARAGKKISVSPDQKTLLFGGKIISVAIARDGSLAATPISSALPKEFYQIGWSPDSQKFGYIDTNNKTWVMDTQGKQQQLQDGDYPPEWSYDGHWMAYCDKTGTVWVGEDGKPLGQVASSALCSITWSPTANTLAYSSFPANETGNYADGTVYLYDPTSGQSKQILQGISGAGWSPDGKLMNFSRVTAMGASSYSFDLYAFDPATGTELKVDELYSRMAGNFGWIRQQDGYLLSRYSFPADLSAKNMLADTLFDITADGKKIITGSTDGSSMQISCQDMGTNASYPLIKAELSDTPGASMPGVYAQFSPDGNWVVTYDYNGSETPGWIGHCDTSAPQPLPGNFQLDNTLFSPDGRWFISQQTHSGLDQDWKIYLLDLANDQVKSLQAGADSNSAWVQLPEQPVYPTETPAPPPTQASPLPGVPGKPADLSWLLGLCCLIPLLLLAGYLLWRRFREAKRTPAQTPSPAVSKPIAPAPAASTQTIPAAPVVVAAPKPSDQEIEAAYQKAVSLAREGQVEASVTALKWVLEQEPQNANAWFWLGTVSVRQKSTRTAERCFLQAQKYGHTEAGKALDWLKKIRD